ncbi:hypothetical protein B7486_56650 [cyanobacterium TDX16]|nr:hypothetical protein B7486_56650 [cyanobacterium TDX16]
MVWADLGGAAGRRPVCVLTRDDAIDLLHAVTIAPITRTIRDLPTEVLVGREHGLSDDSAISCDNLATVRKGQLDSTRIGTVDPATRAELDLAIRYALDLRY